MSKDVKRYFRQEVAQMGTQLVTLGRAAEGLQVSRDTLRRLAASGQLKVVRISRRVLVPTSEIARIMEGGIGRYAGQKVRAAK
jgi:excisionase family DNA binding protein